MKLLPNSSDCLICGVNNPIGMHLHFYKVDEDQVTADCVIPENFQGYSGLAHGGIITALLDEVAVRAFIKETEPRRYLLTVKISTVFRKPVPVNEPVRLSSKVQSDNGKISVAKAYILNKSGDMLAEAEATFITASEEQIQNLGLRQTQIMDAPEVNQ